ncbi:MAG: hypothetical protein MHM6MM_001776 [Cercozoa sp. M6MM]
MTRKSSPGWSLLLTVLVAVCALLPTLTVANTDTKIPSAIVKHTDFFYLFGKEQVLVVDSTTDSVYKVIPCPGVDGWGDVVNVPESNMVFAAHRGRGALYGFDVVNHEVKFNISLSGGMAGHLYHVAHRGEIWVNVMSKGVWDVFHVEQGELVLREVPAMHHGSMGMSQLAFNPRLGDRAFSSNTHAMDGNIAEIDMETGELVDMYNITALDMDGGSCGASHFVVLSLVSRHLFVECVHEEATLEIDTSVKNGSLVQKFPFRGAMAHMDFGDFTDAVDLVMVSSADKACGSSMVEPQPPAPCNVSTVPPEAGFVNGTLQWLVNRRNGNAAEVYVAAPQDDVSSGASEVIALYDDPVVADHFDIFVAEVAGSRIHVYDSADVLDPDQPTVAPKAIIDNVGWIDTDKVGHLRRHVAMGGTNGNVFAAFANLEGSVTFVHITEDDEYRMRKVYDKRFEGVTRLLNAQVHVDTTLEPTPTQPQKVDDGDDNGDANKTAAIVLGVLFGISVLVIIGLGLKLRNGGTSGFVSDNEMVSA